MSEFEYRTKLAWMNGEQLIKCKRCGHDICPHCGNWCDTLANNESEINERGIVEIKESGYVVVIGKSDNDRFPVLCCGGSCVIDGVEE